MKIHIALFTLILLGSGCSAPTETASDETGEESRSDAIVHGRADLGDPAVVAIDVGGQGLCTGSLIGARWVLTARHCVSVTAEAVGCPSEDAQILADRDPASLTILVGKDVLTAEFVARGAALVVPSSDQLCEADIALIHLDRPVTSIEPLPVRLAGGPAPGSYVRAVGFGKRGQKAGAGKKYFRDHVRVLERTTRELVVGESTCSGDSGGPVLDGSGAVVGVASRGGPECVGLEARNVYTLPSAFPWLLKEAQRY